jgi:transmembrane sensor
MNRKRERVFDASPANLEEEASEIFVQRLHGEWTPADQAAFETRLERDSAYADAYRRVEASWSSLDTHAESPQLMGYREEAIAYARKKSAGPWLKENRYTRRPWRAAAAAAGIALAIAAAWQLSPYGYTPGQYITGIGEQRIVDLEDHSRITLDAATRLQVRYTKDARLIDLKQGQAQFSVAKDPTRPFKVVAGNQTIIAVGTVFTVEYVDRKIHVAMMEGRVAVVPEKTNAAAPDAVLSTSSDSTNVRVASSKNAPSQADPQGGTIELSAGEELHVARDGHTVVTPKADLEAAIAWREGKVIIRTESLGEAVERLNRYSKLQIKISDEELANKHISGVFEAGDTQGFVSAVQRYLPVETDYSESNTVRLSLR